MNLYLALWQCWPSFPDETSLCCEALLSVGWLIDLIIISHRYFKHKINWKHKVHYLLPWTYFFLSWYLVFTFKDLKSILTSIEIMQRTKNTAQFCFIHLLAWEPGFAWKRKLSIKVNPLNLEFLNQTNNISVVLPSCPIYNWGKSVQGFTSNDRHPKRNYYLTIEVVLVFIFFLYYSVIFNSFWMFIVAMSFYMLWKYMLILV